MQRRQNAYRIYFLKRLAHEKSRGRFDALDVLDASMAAVQRHALETVADASERERAITDAENALDDIRRMLDEPDFDIDEELRRMQAAQEAASRRDAAAAASGQQPETRKLERSSDRMAGAVRAPVSAQAGGMMQPRPAWPPQPRGGGWKALVAAALMGCAAGALSGYFAGAASIPSASAVVGDWRWPDNVKGSFRKDGSFAFNDRVSGHYFATSARHVVIVHNNGRFIDYLTLEPDGRRLVGYSAAGISITATRAP